jgi:hypothetical protein
VRIYPYEIGFSLLSFVAVEKADMLGNRTTSVRVFAFPLEVINRLMEFQRTLVHIVALQAQPTRSLHTK